jgi:hypothetical protein
MKINKKKVFNAIMFILFISLLLYAIESGRWWAFVVYILAFIAFGLWKSRESIHLGMATAESKIFGKPLEKEYWQKGELKNHKVKFVWKKKK